MAENEICKRHVEIGMEKYKMLCAAKVSALKKRIKLNMKTKINNLVLESTKPKSKHEILLEDLEKLNLQ